MNEQKNNKFYELLAKVQAEIEMPKLSKPSVFGKYADLTECLNAVKPALNNNGFTLLQPFEHTESGMLLKTIIIHSSGAKIESAALIPYPASGDSKNIQRFGGNITYLRRYSICSLLGIAGEEDLDGHDPKNSREKNQNDDAFDWDEIPTIPAKQRTILLEKSKPAKQIINEVEAGETPEMPAPEFRACKESIYELEELLKLHPRSDYRKGLLMNFKIPNFQFLTDIRCKEIIEVVKTRIDKALAESLKLRTKKEANNG